MASRRIEFDATKKVVDIDTGRQCARDSYQTCVHRVIVVYEDNTWNDVGMFAKDEIADAYDRARLPLPAHF